MAVQVHIVAGHLGAGKTSVLRHLLARIAPGERVGVVVNDFGEAAIDATLLGAGSATTREIRGSCVCCTAPEGFAASVGELLDDVDRLFVEPTGLARPSDLIDTLRRAPYADRLQLGPLVVVVDPRELARGHVPHDAEDQLAAAEIVVANRCDLASEGDLAALHQRLGALWPGPARIHEVTFGQVPPTVLAPGDGRARSAHHHHHVHGDEAAARSLVVPPDRVYALQALIGWWSTAPLIRAKGLFRTDEGWRVVQLAGGEVSVEPTSWRSDSRMDAIASDAATLEDLPEALERCRATRAEAGLVELAWPGGTRTFDREALLALPGRVDDVAARFPKRAGSGASLRALLEAAGAPLEGTLVVAAADGFTSDPVDVRQALDGGVLVDSVDGDALPSGQGGPFRLLVPGSVPCANVKAVSRLVVR